MRRREKHELIKNNRKALVAIFGDAIFKRGWPVSRKEIKLALGLKEEEHDKAAFLGEFLEMVKKTTENGCSSNNSKVKMNLGPNEVSRMVRISSPKLEEESAEPTAYSIEEVSPKVPQYRAEESDFPSLCEASSSKKK